MSNFAKLNLAMLAAIVIILFIMIAPNTAEQRRRSNFIHANGALRHTAVLLHLYLKENPEYLTKELPPDIWDRLEEFAKAEGKYHRPDQFYDIFREGGPNAPRLEFTLAVGVDGNKRKFLKRDRLTLIGTPQFLAIVSVGPDGKQDLFPEMIQVQDDEITVAADGIYHPTEDFATKGDLARIIRLPENELIYKSRLDPHWNYLFREDSASELGDGNSD